MTQPSSSPSHWHTQLYSIFPEIFPGPLQYSLAGKALQKGLWSYESINLRHYTTDKHQSVDDTPYGGGAGMVMRADVIGRALEATLKPNSTLLYMSPRGRLLQQHDVEYLSKRHNVAILCGRYEGIDQRIIDYFAMEEVSIGDYILSGGEMAALTLMDSCIRLLPGVVGNDDTHAEESFSKTADFTGLLEYPLYTRPMEWNGLAVPDVLVSGNHSRIKEWRYRQAECITKERRPDLWRHLRKKD